MMTPKKLTVEQQQTADTLKKIVDQIVDNPKLIISEKERKETRLKQGWAREKLLDALIEKSFTDFIATLGFDDLKRLKTHHLPRFNKRLAAEIKKQINQNQSIEKKVSGRPPRSEKDKMLVSGVVQLSKELGLDQEKSKVLVGAVLATESKDEIAFLAACEKAVERHLK